MGTCQEMDIAGYGVANTHEEYVLNFQAKVAELSMRMVNVDLDQSFILHEPYPRTSFRDLNEIELSQAVHSPSFIPKFMVEDAIEAEINQDSIACTSPVDEVQPQPPCSSIACAGQGDERGIKPELVFAVASAERHNVDKCLTRAVLSLQRKYLNRSRVREINPFRGLTEDQIKEAIQIWERLYDQEIDRVKKSKAKNYAKVLREMILRPITRVVLFNCLTYKLKRFSDGEFRGISEKNAPTYQHTFMDYLQYIQKMSRYEQFCQNNSSPSRMDN